MFFPESSLNRRPSTLFILDHVLTTTYNNRPHLTTLFGDCFDGFNKRGNQLGFKPLIATKEHIIIRRIQQKRRREIPDSSLLAGYLHLAPLQGGDDAAFGKGCKAREGGLGF